MKWFILLVYTLSMYGLTYMVTNSYGPKNIFLRLRIWAENVGPNFGMLFKCPLCFPSNIGWIVSLINWFVSPELGLTPFNIVFQGVEHTWYYLIIAMIGDCCYTGGVCKIIYNVDDFIDKSTPIFED